MIQKKFCPGSEWVYFKIYIGCKSSDDLLINEIIQILNKLERDKITEKYFFIRYNDPDPHLRIRLLLTNTNKLQEVICMFEKRMKRHLKNGIIEKIQLDTYIRELERYSSDLIAFSESIFHIDSRYILRIIKVLKNSMNSNNEFRWMVSLLLLDSMLNILGFNLNEKCELMTILSSSFKSEFGFNDFNSKSLNSKYREYKEVVNMIISHSYNNQDFIKLSSLVEKRSKHLKLLIIDTQINPANAKSNAHSYIHMTMNRLFNSQNRMYELLIYDFLKRFYESSIYVQNNNLKSRMN